MILKGFGTTENSANKKLIAMIKETNESIWAHKNQSGTFSEGIPDFLICTSRSVLWLEAKTIHLSDHPAVRSSQLLRVGGTRSHPGWSTAQMIKLREAQNTGTKIQPGGLIYVQTNESRIRLVCVPMRVLCLLQDQQKWLTTRHFMPIYDHPRESFWVLPLIDERIRPLKGVYSLCDFFDHRGWSE